MSVLKHSGPGFAAVPNSTVDDPALSFRAVGVLTYLLSKPENWSVRSTALAEAHSEGRDAVRAALRELEKAGYYAAAKVQCSDGTWITTTSVAAVPWDFDLDEPRTPGPEKPSPVPTPENPTAGNPGPIPLTKTEDKKEAPSEVVAALCEHLAERIGDRSKHKPKVTSQWHQEMDRLLRLGCPEWAEPEPIPPEKVERMIDFVFTNDELEGTFCWADQIRSAVTLRKQWEKLRTWANRKMATPDSAGVTQEWMVRNA